MHQSSGSWKVLLWLLLPWWWSNAWRFLQSLLHPSCLSQPERPPHHLLWQRSQTKTNQIIATPLQANLTGATTLWSRWSAISMEWPSRQSLRPSTSSTWIMMYVRLWESLNLFFQFTSLADVQGALLNARPYQQAGADRKRRNRAGEHGCPEPWLLSIVSQSVLQFWKGRGYNRLDCFFWTRSALNQLHWNEYSHNWKYLPIRPATSKLTIDLLRK